MKLAAVIALGLALAAIACVHGSQATFTARATNGAASFATASDWAAPAVTLTSPADGLYTKVTTPSLSGAAGTATGDAATVTVRIYAGSSATGTPVQTLTAPRSGASWSATAAALANGTYTAQAMQSDSSGNVGTSTANTFTIDTVAPTASGIAAANKGGTGTTAGKLDAGDTITFTFSEPIAPASVLSGWSGASTAVRVKFTNAAGADTFTVLDASGGTTVKLGSVATNGDYVTATTTITGSTMALSADAKSVVVTLGTPSNVSLLANGAKNMTWTPSTAVTDRAGNAASAASVTETASDVDF